MAKQKKNTTASRGKAEDKLVRELRGIVRKKLEGKKKLKNGN